MFAVFSVRTTRNAFKYAVVHWFHYRKELSAGFRQGFVDFECARKFAYDCAYKDMIRFGTSDKVITEDKITDINGPGKDGSPYKSLIGYGGRRENEYMTRFYCVVDWFEGVTNDRDDWDESEGYKEEDGKWYPIYRY